MKNRMKFSLLALVFLTAQGCSLPRYDAGTMTVPSNTSSSSSTADAVNSRPTDGTGRTGATPTGANSGTSPNSGGMPSMGTANSTSSGISGDELAAIEAERAETLTRFASQAINSGIYEIQLNELALKNTQNDAVKKLAATIVKNYNKANNDLKDLAGSRGVMLPKSSSTNMRTLSASSGKEFDQAYLKIIIGDHQKAIKLFQETAKSSDRQLKEYALRYLPVLKTHLEQAKTITP